MVYEILDPANYLTADVTADFTGDHARAGRTGRGADQRCHRPTSTRDPEGEHGLSRWFRRRGSQFTYTWPDAWAKSQRGLEFLRNRLRRADFVCEDELVEYVGHSSMWGDRIAPPTDPDTPEVVVRFAARCATPEEARKVFTESVPLYNNGPAGVAGVGTRPPLKELFAIWPALVPREHITTSVELLEV